MRLAKLEEVQRQYHAQQHQLHAKQTGVPLPGLETGRTSRAPDPHDHVALLRCFPAEGGETGSACMDKGAPGPADLCGVRWRSPPAAADTPVLVSWLARAG